MTVYISDLTNRLFDIEAKGDQRAGQWLYNCLRALRPDIAEEICTTDADPFYDDKKIPACWERIITLW
jgi:hypothetical protein